MKFDTFENAFPACLAWVYRKPSFENAPRGRRSRERLALHVEITDPVQRVVDLPGRQTDLVYGLAKSLWYLAGSDELAFIAHYAPAIRALSEDGRTVAGTAYGRRIFAYGSDRLDQWQQVIAALRADPDSKRAVLQIFDTHELQRLDAPDVACTLAMQVFQREGRLHAVVFMRANDAFGEFVSDVFCFTMLQEALAGELGLAVGSYHHIVGSFHVYEPDFAATEKLLAAASLPRSSPARDRFPAMPPADNRPHLRQVLELETLLRENRLQLTPQALAELPLPGYWKQVAAVLEAHRGRVFDGYARGDVVKMLPAAWQVLLRGRLA